MYFIGVTVYLIQIPNSYVSMTRMAKISNKDKVVTNRNKLNALSGA